MTEAPTKLRNRWHYLLWTLPFVLAFVFYFPAVRNCFIYDDFIWLYKAKTFLRHPAQIFQPDVVYFDPIVHLSFWIDYTIAHLDYQWFHLVDIAIHSLNGLLLYFFVKQYAGDRLLAATSSALFVTTFATVDAVVWSSSRVDLFLVAFSLATLIFFHRYLAGGGKKFLALSVLAFVCALGSKGTALVVPALLAGLLVQEKEVAKRYLALAPFVLLDIIYLVSLKYAFALQGKAMLSGGGSAINLQNFNMALAELFVPEGFFTVLNFHLTAVLLSLLLLMLALLNFGPALDKVKLFGLLVIIAGIVPVLVLKDFKQVSSMDTAMNVLTSPSHRIYLASVGMALFSASVLRWLQLSLPERFGRVRGGAAIAVCLAILAFNHAEVTKRVAYWSRISAGTQRNLAGLLPYKDSIKEDSVVGLVNFIGSRGFLQPMLKVYFDVDSLIILPVRFIDIRTDNGMFEYPEILERAERASFFVAGGSSVEDMKVYDLTPQFRDLLGTINRWRLPQEAPQRVRRVEEYRSGILSFSHTVERCKGLIRLGMERMEDTVRGRLAALREVRHGGGCG